MKARYIIAKKYNEKGVRQNTFYDGEVFTTLNKAFWYESQRDATKALKKITDKGIFQAEPFYINL